MARVTAETLSRKQREISVSEFFAKNRHLLGFDSLRKALLTTVKEAVDNSLDACEEAGILPEIWVELEAAKGANRYLVRVTDNGPGIVPEQAPKIFGQLLYGSKFHSLKQSRGQQGIGISAAAMYGQLTTGKPVSVESRTGPAVPAYAMQVMVDTNTNKPKAIGRRNLPDWHLDHGTLVEVELEAKYLKGRQSVEEFLHQVAVANPHVTLHYRSPNGDTDSWARTVERNPAAPREIKPHPHGVELGVLMKMLQSTRHKTVTQFLSRDFSRISPQLAGGLAKRAGIKAKARPNTVARQAADALYKAINDSKTRIRPPSTDCLSPIGVQELLAGLTRGVRAEFYGVETRKPAVYRGNPFQVEVGLAWGGDLAGDELAKVLRFANRVPLQYYAGSCCITKAVMDVSWRTYGLTQSRGALPSGPLIVLVHLASVWVPFSSESKVAVADYDEIRKEIKLAVQTCGRRLGQYVKRKARARSEARRREVFNLYIEEVVSSVEAITGKEQKLFRDRLLAISRRKTELAGMLEETKGATGEDLEACENVLVVDPDAAPPAADAAATAPANGEDGPPEDPVPDEVLPAEALEPLDDLPPPLPAEPEQDRGSQLELV
ncbi:MAG: DNA topoisomerase VI subunit B [Acidobacteria bacterium]|nr:DNA topoisomerase VI subunit B [Acidobacteriota bacterium]MCY3964914.1 DNA topoisomerase VI subunit B [Acidobacteriota bacterium]